MNESTEAEASVALELWVLLDFVDEMELGKESGYVDYTTRSMLRTYLYMLVKRIKGFKSLAKHLELKPEVRKRLGLKSCPHRTTLSRRFKEIPEVVREQIRQLHGYFVSEGVTRAEVMSGDSSLMNAQGNVWHKKQMEQGELPSCGNIDKEAHWGVSGCKKWVYGYRIHCLVSAASEAALPCDVEVEPANIKDAQVFKEELIHSIPEQTKVVLADGGFDDQSCYELCDQKGVSLIAPIKVKKSTPPERVERAKLYHDPEVRELFSLRKTTVEPFQGRLKALFELEHLFMKGHKNVRALVLLASLAYLLLAKLNFLLGFDILKLQDTLIAIR
ncbi:MAG: transposase [Deinococcales bacterium]